MKAATGELNLTIITVLAISAVIAFFWFLWPTIKDTVSDNVNNITDGGSDPTGTSFIVVK
ncbi:MAG: hypothetical protein IJH13_03095 [Bacilli bacterium]|nr:hypothetical protein [Bacilli bacterium]